MNKSELIKAAEVLGYITGTKLKNQHGDPVTLGDGRYGITITGDLVKYDCDKMDSEYKVIWNGKWVEKV